MQFFIPHADGPEQTERVHASVRAFLTEQGYRTNGRRIQRIAFHHNRQSLEAEVGKRFDQLREEVIAIFQDSDRQIFLVCTANRGVVRGDPYLVGDDARTITIDFDPPSSD